jgi:transposase
MGMQRRRFSSEFKQEAVALVRRSGQSANQVAKELGVSQTALSRWLREAATPVSSPNGLRAAEELKSLRREVERLRMERDILKKAAAFFANESR